MRLNKIIKLIFCCFLVFQCQKEGACTQFEQKVFYEIFPEVIDSIYIDYRLLPPPPPPFQSKDGEIIRKDSLRYKIMTDKWKAKKQKIEKDTSFVSLVIIDSVVRFEKEDIRELSNHFKNHDLIIDSQYITLGGKFKIDLNKLKTNNRKLDFKYSSKFPKSRYFWKFRDKNNIAGRAGFSRILFDKTKSYGVFNCGFSSGFLNGSGYRIFIRKNDKGKWIIDKIVKTWVS